MGYRGHDDWKDMSDFVVHFTKPMRPNKLGTANLNRPPRAAGLAAALRIVAERRRADRTGYSPWIEILDGGQLRPGDKPLGAGRKVQEVTDLHRAVCFSEIPLDMLDRLVQRRSSYGIGFRKDFIATKGGAPLWYLDKDGLQAQVIQSKILTAASGGIDPDDPLWKLTPFIDSPGNYAGAQYRFEWEREWRVVGTFEFTPKDVAFLFLPEVEHHKARQFFADVEVEHSGPAYLCAYIDPHWDLATIEKALENVPATPPPSSNARPWWL